MIQTIVFEGYQKDIKHETQINRVLIPQTHFNPNQQQATNRNMRNDELVRLCGPQLYK